MTRLRTLPVSLQKSIQNRSLLKVISGLNNFNPESVFRISKAAGIGGADLLDIACDPKLVELAVEASNIPVCVSSVEPKLFTQAVKAGDQREPYVQARQEHRRLVEGNRRRRAHGAHRKEAAAANTG